MNITILSVDIKTTPTAKGSYQTADVAYKNNTFQGKVEGKKVMSFGATAASFKTLAQATAGESYEVSIVKNDKGYNDWVSMSKAGAADAGAPQTASAKPTTATASPRSTYETPEERAQRQIYIIRQSSISAAVSSLAAGAKAAVEPSKVLAVAKQYEDYVLGKGASGFEDLPDFDEKEFPDVV
ncbi:MAG: hypothetical protein KGI54_10640 [Pseudomonadota bacterium]|nr:hypothetical protein [Pseudomonadota bacterium]